MKDAIKVLFKFKNEFELKALKTLIGDLDRLRLTNPFFFNECVRKAILELNDEEKAKLDELDLVYGYSGTIRILAVFIKAQCGVAQESSAFKVMT